MQIFDLSANEDVIKVAREALDMAKVYDAYLCVSVGIKNDPHVEKAVIDYERCVNCGACEEICPQKAIQYAKVKKKDVLVVANAGRYVLVRQSHIFQKKKI